MIGTTGNEAWSNGEWNQTIKGQGLEICRAYASLLTRRLANAGREWTNFRDCPFAVCASALSHHQSYHQEDHKLAKPNYQFEKRKRDNEKKAKKEEKKLRKLKPADPAPPTAETK
jgi:hypothetical protein